MKTCFVCTSRLPVSAALCCGCGLAAALSLGNPWPHIIDIAAPAHRRTPADLMCVCVPRCPRIHLNYLRLKQTRGRVHGAARDAGYTAKWLHCCSQRRGIQQSGFSAATVPARASRSRPKRGWAPGRKPEPQFRGGSALRATLGPSGRSSVVAAPRNLTSKLSRYYRSNMKPSVCTVAILAQGTRRAVAVTQAF